MTTILRTGPIGITPARRIHNPTQGDWVTFVETARESAGVRTVLEIEVAPGGGNPLHVHRQFSECFEVLDGELEIQLGADVQRLVAGRAAVARAGEAHRWTNASIHPARFRVTLYPGHTGFEHGLRILYGLAADGHVSARGIPRSLTNLAVITALWDSAPTGHVRLLAPLLRRLARRARAKGRERELMERYCG